ncbi:hypothetical protein TRICI_001139 [Trichomonascus ciferrii]|uniref:Uncharacterized protein n=1 Tax=Trichomonascus ciferrii TaxID=44093 RepID=A0A642VA94_9ASCO|nr:hypothetical protein TRICI_001139 [Trichomonascus ciferrii]
MSNNAQREIQAKPNAKLAVGLNSVRKRGSRLERSETRNKLVSSEEDEVDEPYSDDEEEGEVINVVLNPPVVTRFSFDEEEATICGDLNTKGICESYTPPNVFDCPKPICQEVQELWDIFERRVLSGGPKSNESFWSCIVKGSTDDEHAEYWIQVFIPNMLVKLPQSDSNGFLVKTMDLFLVLTSVASTRSWVNIVQSLLDMMFETTVMTFAATSILLILSKIDPITPELAMAILRKDCYEPKTRYHEFRANWLKCIAIRSRKYGERNQTLKLVRDALAWKANFGDPKICKTYRDVCSKYSPHWYLHLSKEYRHLHEIEVLQFTVNTHLHDLYASIYD